MQIGQAIPFDAFSFIFIALKMIYHGLERQMLAVKDVGQATRRDEVMLLLGISLLLEAQVVYLRQLRLEGIVGGEEQIGQDLLKVVPLVILQLHDIPQFRVWNDLSGESFNSSVTDKVSANIFLVLLDHVLKEVLFLLVQLLLITVVLVVIRQTEEVVVALARHVFFDEQLGA